jgi:hypothetical protein
VEFSKDSEAHLQNKESNMDPIVIDLADDNPPRGNGPTKAAKAAKAEVTESVIDQFAYPVLTEEVSFPTPAPASTGGGGTGTGSLARTVDAAMRDILGGRTKTPKDFAARLAQSFNLTDVDGHIEARWVPPTSVQVQADLGAITGAQASIYARAKAALDESLPLLDRLASLRTDILPEDQEATRSIVRTEMTQLVGELGIEGGPRDQRVDELFGYLLGTPPPAPLTADQLVGNRVGHLGELGYRFGMQRKRVNTIEDEQDFTNFIILVDYTAGLLQTWNAQKGFFSRLPSGVEPFFGTQMVLLSRALAVVGESVQEVNFTMDSVFLGPAERQTLTLNYDGTSFNLPNVPPPGSTLYPFPSPTSPLFVAELLDWIDRVASEEGPRLIQDAGKDGVFALSPTLQNLRSLARGALTLPYGGVQDPTSVPKGYTTSRVQRSISELADSLDAALLLASKIQGLQL